MHKIVYLILGFFYLFSLIVLHQLFLRFADFGILGIIFGVIFVIAFPPLATYIAYKYMKLYEVDQAVKAGDVEVQWEDEDD